MEYLRRPAWAGAATLLMAAALTAGISAQKSKDTKDKDQKDARSAAEADAPGEPGHRDGTRARRADG